MALTKEQIQQIAAQTRSSFESGSFAPTGVQCLFDDVHDAIDTAIRAQHQLMDMSLEERGKLIEAMRVCAREHAEELAILAHEETGYGKVPHKIAKNLLAANKTPGIEDLHPTAFSGDNGLTLVETAPYGVIGAITPSTNPSETVLCNSIGMLAAGNSVVFNPHPSAIGVSSFAVQLVNQASIAAGGPANIATTVRKPTLETADVMYKSPVIPLLVATGGPGVVTAVLLGALFTVGALLFPQQVTAVFSKGSAELTALAVPGLMLYFLNYLVSGVNLLLIARFAAAERSRDAAVLSLLRGVILVVPCAVVLANIFGLTGLWLAVPTAEVLSLLCGLYLLYREKKSEKTALQAA